jgi:hypothetical protein
VRTRVWVAVLVLLASCSAQETPRPAPEPMSEPVSEPTTAAPVVQDPALSAIEAAMPREVLAGRFRSMDSCLASRQTCPALREVREVPGLSWLRASTGSGGSPDLRWADIGVVERPAPGLLRRTLREARQACPRRFVVPPQPRGFFPLPEEVPGTATWRPVDLEGFRGLHCRKRVGSENVGWRESTWIWAVRDGVRLEISSGSDRLADRLLRTYVAALGRRP